MLEKNELDLKNRLPLIILPGWNGSHETWKDFIALAERDFDVHCIDLPCFGAVPCPAEVWGVGEYAAYVKKQLLNLAFREQPILLGHSFGGQVAVQVAANNPELFSKLILSAAAVIRPFHPIRRAFFFAVAKTGKLVFRLPLVERGTLFAKKLLYHAAHSPDYSKTAEIKRDIFKKIIRQDLQHLLPTLTLPTLVVWGTRDGYLPVKDAKKITAVLPQATLRIIPGGTHGLHIKALEAFYSHIVEFAKYDHRP